MLGQLFIVLSAVTSVTIAHFLKVTESRSLNTIRVLTVNYFVATAAALLYASIIGSTKIDFEILFQPLLLSVGVGALFIANFFIYSKSVFHNGVGISIAAMRISLIIPVLLSTFWYLEILTSDQWIGILLVFVTLFLLLPNKKSLIRTDQSLNKGWLLLLLFLGTGFGDASLKYYEMEYSQWITKEFFMGMVFMTAFLIGMIYILWKKSWQFTREEIFVGIAIGVPNLLTSVFLISALELMNGAIVYSSVNVLTVLGGTLLGVIYWKDRFSNMQWTGIFLTVLALVLLVI
tara:strand:- start:23089 stop:23958 length:870 start_codon:yes stop_codon:yes gene_type:complete